MAKTLVIDADQRNRVPFLRGILTRSLQDAGLGFEEAYRLASEVRDELAETEQITTEALRERVLRQLRKQFGEAAAQRYATPRGPRATILVRDPDGQLLPFSRVQHQRCLESSGLPPEQAAKVTAKMHDHLVKKSTSLITSPHLGRLTYRCLQQDLGSEVARRYLVWTEFLHSGRPLVVLIGGTTGCGKSTLATELANRLEIVRTQSTDMLREVMRMMIPQRLLPVLHSSSFNAWQVLPHPDHATDPDALLADGYRTQAELLAVPCEAVVQRAIRERVSLILEGVHVQPALMERLPADSDTIIVPIMLAVLKPEKLRKRIKGRGKQTPQRRAERYIEHFDNIWRLQSYLLSEADRLQVPIVANDDKERAAQEAMGIIVDTMSKDFQGSASAVFQERTSSAEAASP